MIHINVMSPQLRQVLNSRRCRERHPENYRSSYQRWYERNNDKKCELVRAYRKANPEKINALNREWRFRNPEKVKVNRIAARAKRRAAIWSSLGAFTYGEWIALLDRHGWICLRCKRSINEIQLVPDHVVPLCRGGSNGIENIQPLCNPCNSKKFDKSWDYREEIK